MWTIKRQKNYNLLWISIPNWGPTAIYGKFYPKGGNGAETANRLSKKVNMANEDKIKEHLKHFKIIATNQQTMVVHFKSQF